MWKSLTRNNQAKLESVNDIEDGQKFIEKEFEEQKEKIKDLIKDNKKMFSDNQSSDYITKSLIPKQSQEENQIEINKLAHYNRSSFMLTT